jgi:hypothetical protein
MSGQGISTTGAAFVPVMTNAALGGLKRVAIGDAQANFAGRRVSVSGEVSSPPQHGKI